MNLTALYFLSEEKRISSIASTSSSPNSFISASMVLLTLPVELAYILMMSLASPSSMKVVISLKMSLFVVMVPVLSMQTVFTWLMDSTELERCRSTSLSAMRMAAIMYDITISRNSAMGTMSRTMTRLRSTFFWISSHVSYFIRLRTRSSAKNMNAMDISSLVTADVSIWRGDILFLYFFALTSILDANESSPNAVTL